MSHAALVEMVHDQTGLVGAELEMRVHFLSMILADALGNKAIGDYYQRRMRDAAAKANKPKPVFKYRRAC